MEYNDLDGYDDMHKVGEMAERLARMYNNASAFASLHKEPLLRQKLGEIEAILAEYLEEVETDWQGYQWKLRNREFPAAGFEQEIRNLELAYKQAMKTAEFAIAEHKKTAQSLLALCQRKPSGSPGLDAA